jgi:HD superfamily phosphodiesterase
MLVFPHKIVTGGPDVGRVDRILQDSFFQECMTRNQMREINRKFCKHTLQHVIDVARITYIIMLEKSDIKLFISEHNLSGREQAKEIIYAAALLHDIARWREYETGEDHAACGAEAAVAVLERAGFSREETKIITRAIREHRRMVEDVSILGERLCRADNLSRACTQCEASGECYKIDDMETGTKFFVY